MNPLLTIMTSAGSVKRETVALAGTSGSPRLALQLGFQETNYAGWCFAGVDVIMSSIEKGDAQWDGRSQSESASYVSDNQATTWIDEKDYSGSYWIYADLDSGDTPNAAGNSTLDTWHSLTSSNHFWVWQADSGEMMEGTIRVRISDDSMGTNILATGYYRGSVSSTDS